MTYLPSSLIAAWLTVPQRTVQRWAREDQWASQGQGRTATYSLEDAAASYERRRLNTLHSQGDAE